MIRPLSLHPHNAASNVPLNSASLLPMLEKNKLNKTNACASHPFLPFIFHLSLFLVEDDDDASRGTDTISIFHEHKRMARAG